MSPGDRDAPGRPTTAWRAEEGRATGLRTIWLMATVALWGLLTLLAMRRSRYHAVILARYSPEYTALLAAVAALAALVTAAGWAPVSGLLARVRHKLALLAVSILVSLAMLEGLVRVLDPLGASFYEEVKRYQLILRPDPLLIYVQPPGHRSVYGGVEVAVNELGLRERPLAPRVPGARRVLVLGDSVVFGWGVPADQTFARRVEPELRGRLGQPVETINSGVPGYSTVMELQFLRRHGPALDPDAIGLVYVDNDVEVAVPLPRDLGASPATSARAPRRSATPWAGAGTFWPNSGSTAWPITSGRCWPPRSPRLETMPGRRLAGRPPWGLWWGSPGGAGSATWPSRWRCIARSPGR